MSCVYKGVAYLEKTDNSFINVCLVYFLNYHTTSVYYNYILSFLK